MKNPTDAQGIDRAITYTQWAKEELNLRPHAYQLDLAGVRIPRKNR